MTSALNELIASSEAEYWMSIVRVTRLTVDFTEISSPIHDAITQNDLGLVKALLSQPSADIEECGNDHNVTPLAFACVHDDSDILPRKRFQASNDRHQIVKFLIERGANVNAICDVPSGAGTRLLNVTPVHLAVWENDERLLQLLIQSGADVNKAIGPSGMTPLHVAACCDYPRVCEILIHSGARVNEVDVDGNTALIIACGLGNDVISNFLLKRKDIDVHRTNLRQWNALHAACLGGGDKLVKRLLQMGVNVNSSTVEAYTPLDIVLFKERNILTELLKKQGAINDPNALINAAVFAHVTPNYCKVSSLHIAAEEGDLQIMETLLLEKGFDINLQDAIGRTPLFFATLKGHVESVIFLLERQANPNISITSDPDNVALMFATISGFEEIVKLLTSHGASTDGKFLHGVVHVNPTESRGYIRRKAGIARHLILKNAPIDILDSDGRTPYESARQKNIPSVIMSVLKVQYDLLSSIQHCNLTQLRKCIKQDAVLDCRSVKFKSPLQYAVSKGDFDIVDCLIESGADVNYAPVGGVTALHYAAQFNQERIARRLLQSGAARDVRTVKSGKTPLDFCQADSATEKLLKGIEGAPLELSVDRAFQLGHVEEEKRLSSEESNKKT